MRLPCLSLCASANCRGTWAEGYARRFAIAACHRRGGACAARQPGFEGGTSAAPYPDSSPRSASPGTQPRFRAMQWHGSPLAYPLAAVANRVTWGNARGTVAGGAFPGTQPRICARRWHRLPLVHPGAARIAPRAPGRGTDRPSCARMRRKSPLVHPSARRGSSASACRMRNSCAGERRYAMSAEEGNSTAGGRLGRWGHCLAWRVSPHAYGCGKRVAGQSCDSFATHANVGKGTCGRGSGSFPRFARPLLLLGVGNAWTFFVCRCD